MLNIRTRVLFVVLLIPVVGLARSPGIGTGASELCQYHLRDTPDPGM